jgi:putative transposase
MRPDKETNNAFIYCLAVSAQRFGIGVVGFGTMSNHYHAVIVDNEGCLPDFLQFFHRIFAVHQNVLRGRWEAFWAPHEQPSVVELLRPDDLLEKLVYAITNPVNDALVDKVEHWPGAACLPSLVSGRTMVATRPRRFFRDNGPFPDSACLELSASPFHSDLLHPEWAKLVAGSVDASVQNTREMRIKSGKCVVGAKAVLAQPWHEAPESYEPRRTMNPHVACRDKWRRIEALQRNRAFLDAYREARLAWMSGGKNVEFPAGVWYLRHFPGVVCAAVPPPH